MRCMMSSCTTNVWTMSLHAPGSFHLRRISSITEQTILIAKILVYFVR